MELLDSLTGIGSCPKPDRSGITTNGFEVAEDPKTMACIGSLGLHVNA
jgi:hypothetical protein